MSIWVKVGCGAVIYALVALFTFFICAMLHFSGLAFTGPSVPIPLVIMTLGAMLSLPIAAVCIVIDAYKDGY